MKRPLIAISVCFLPLLAVSHTLLQDRPALSTPRDTEVTEPVPIRESGTCTGLIVAVDLPRYPLPGDRRTLRELTIRLNSGEIVYAEAHPGTTIFLSDRKLWDPSRIADLYSFEKRELFVEICGPLLGRQARIEVSCGDECAIEQIYVKGPQLQSRDDDAVRAPGSGLPQERDGVD